VGEDTLISGGLIGLQHLRRPLTFYEHNFVSVFPIAQQHVIGGLCDLCMLRSSGKPHSKHYFGILSRHFEDDLSIRQSSATGSG